MNIPPESYVEVPAEQMQSFGAQLAAAAGLPDVRAQLLADLLVGNDLRGVFSHGTAQLATYARLMRDGVLNSDPQPRVVRETASSLLVDGDGGLGYFPAYLGAERLIHKALDSGVAVLVTRDHGHFGAAGLYSRMTLDYDLLCFVTSGHQLALAPGDSVYGAAGGSPMSFSAPTATEDPLLLDFGAMHDLYDDSPHRNSIAAQAPGIVHRAIGLGAVCQAWGGLLAGVPLDPDRAERSFPGANQGSLMMAFRIDLFLPADQFKAEMDRYVRAVSGLESFVDGQRSFLPGGIEAERFRSYSRNGIPVGEAHQATLESVAEEFGLAVPWDR